MNRVGGIIVKRMSDTGIKRGMQTYQVEQPANFCLLVLWTFGPNGTFIKGLVEEKL